MSATQSSDGGDVTTERDPSPGPPPPPPGTLRPGQARPVLPPQPPPPPFSASASAALRAAAVASDRMYREPHRQQGGGWPPRVAGRTISERSMAWGAIVLVVVIAAGALLANWSPPKRPGTATASGATPRPLVMPSESPTRPPVYLNVGDSPSPYPSPDPVLTPSSPPGAKVVRIGISLPLSGTWSADGGPARDAVLEAIQNAGKPGGWTIEPVILDYADGGNRDPDKAGRDVRSFTLDPSIVGVVGPLDSDAAAAELPVANTAGLLQCSPGAADASLTRGQVAKMLNGQNPDKPTFLRVAATTDGQATAMAKWAKDRLRTGAVLVISDSTTMGRALAKEFESSYQHIGGVVVNSVDSPISADGFAAALKSTTNEDVVGVFLGSTNARAAAILRDQMNTLSRPQTYLMTTDATYDNPWPGASWYLAQAGEVGAPYTRAARSVWSDFNGAGAFGAWLKSATHRDPGTYSASAFACAQVILDAITKAAAVQGPITREEIRQTATSGAPVQTILGSISFTKAGDITTQMVTVYGPDSGGDTWYAWAPDLHYQVGLCPVASADGPCYAAGGD